MSEKYENTGISQIYKKAKNLKEQIMKSENTEESDS